MASKKDICEKYEVCGGWPLGAFGGLQVHHIQFGIDEMMYCSYVYAKDIEPTYHRLRVYTTTGGRSYVLFRNRRYFLDECMRTHFGG